MIEIKLVQDLEIAKEIWNKLTPAESIYDLWDLRYCFYKNNPQPLYFYVAYDDTEAVALLPLQYNEKKNYLEFLAEFFIEDNRLFFKKGYEYLLPELLKIDFPHPVKIYDLMGEEEIISSLPLEDYVYLADISDCENFSDYLKKAFPNKHRRHNFGAIFKNLEKNYSIQIVKEDFQDMEKLFDLNVKSFGKESYLGTGRERKDFLDLIKLPLEWKLVTVIVDGVKSAVSLSVIYKETYFYMISGADNSLVKDVFKYLTKINLELAIENGAKIFNTSLGDCNWKQYWHFDKSPRYKLEKNT
ncbi:MAG: GNAT family N-acetyltransferase [Patescibacteria group bacterium]